MVANDQHDTKAALIDAAGALFAEHGFDGVSTRMIADRAGVNLGGIHYYFGGKEALYCEAFRVAVNPDTRVNVGAAVAAAGDAIRTPEGRARIVLEIVRRVFRSFYVPQTPEWRMRFIVRELANPSSALPMLVDEVFRPDYRSVVDLYRTIRPEAEEAEANAWADILFAAMSYYLLAKAPIEMVRSAGCLSEAFYRTAAETVARAMICAAGLPMPEGDGR